MYGPSRNAETFRRLLSGEADKLQTIQGAFAEVQPRVGQLAGRIANIVRCEPDDHAGVYSWEVECPSRENG